MLSAGALAYLGVVQTDTPLGFVPDLPFLAYMGGFFAWGWIVHARPAALAGYARHAGAAAAAAAGLLAIVLISLARDRKSVV